MGKSKGSSSVGSGRQALPIGFSTDKWVIVSHTGDHQDPYIMQCLLCGNIKNGRRVSLTTRCKKCTRPSRDNIDILVYRYKHSAKIRNKDFTLTKKNVMEILSKNCFYCNGKSGGIDRVDNGIGYTYANCVSCCSQCNYMKGRMNISDFLEKIKEIYANISN